MGEYEIILDIYRFKVVCQKCGKVGHIDLTRYIQDFFIKKMPLDEYIDKGEIKSYPDYYVCRGCHG